MVHEMALLCPKCRTSDPFATLVGDGKFQTRLPHCPRCGGDGWLFRDPVVVRGLATSIRQQKNPVDVGHAKPGDMQFSIDPGFGGMDCVHGGIRRRVAESDKFTQTWSSPLDEGQGIVRGSATLGDNARLQTGMAVNEDRLWYQPHEALWCEDENGVVYKTGDFELGPGKIIRWLGNAPLVGVKYAIKYTAYLEWLVWAPPNERVDRDNADLGPLVMIRKKHVENINSSPFATPDDRIPIQSRVAC